MGGGFNDVWSFVEQKSIAIGQINEDYSHFNNFIDDNILLDLPLSGRSFTWFRIDGSTMSRLNIYLLSKEWCV